MDSSGAVHVSYLRHGNFRHLKRSLAGLACALAAYWLTRPTGGGNGGTAYGLTLGVVSTALVVWLMWLGVRKRSYGASGPLLREWVSAHVYLGASLVLLVPLHAGFQFGVNVHTLAYLLLAIVVVSGVAGVLLYATVPSRRAENRRGQSLESMLEQVEALDAECRTAAAGLPDAFAGAVIASIERTQIGGSLFRQLRGGDPATRESLARVRAASAAVGERDRERVKQLIGLLTLKQDLVERIEREIRGKALLDLWLLVHVPFSFASVAAVAAHVILVFYYR